MPSAALGYPVVGPGRSFSPGFSFNSDGWPPAAAVGGKRRREGGARDRRRRAGGCAARSEEHTSELQSLMRISYAVFCLKTKKLNNTIILLTYSTLQAYQ